MLTAPPADDEDLRLEKLRLYEILDTPSEEAFDRITRIVARTLGVEIALVSLIDADRQWFKSRHGLDAEETPRELAFCAHAILQDDVLIVPDATQDARFHDNPLVTGAPDIRFYAGAPLQSPDGVKLGTLCAIDRTPQTLSDDHRQLLTDLAKVVVDEMELRVALRGALSLVQQREDLLAFRDETLSTVTHELRTPLTSMNGTLKLLSSGVVGELTGQPKELVDIASRNCAHMLTMLNDILDLKKFEAGKMELNFDYIDPSALARDVCQEMAGYACDRNVILTQNIQPSATILADDLRLRQVMMNLISNALKFSPDGDTVEVHITEQDHDLTIAVTDHGPGIPKNFRTRVFDHFSQAGGNTKAKGSGLGLPIAKKIVEAHGGTLTFESEPQVATTFSAVLPVTRSMIEVVPQRH